KGRSPARTGITCPTPISIEHADIRVKNYSVNSRERYVCNSGFKRKAGTSTLTECVINKNTNVAHWTTPNLKCIRDPSLAHYSPVPTVVTPKVTSQPESLSPPEKEPEALSPKSDTTVATETAIVPGSRLTPSQAASAGTTGTGRHKSSPAPSLATTMTLEPTASTSLRITEISPHSSEMTKVRSCADLTQAGALCAPYGEIAQMTPSKWFLLKRRHERRKGQPRGSQAGGKQTVLVKGWTEILETKEEQERREGWGAAQCR
uniref:Interleukin 15 receptor subunit alpha n=1 Tax=Rattus norvegicus TaxID=10116 RepID=A0ABK0LQ40_RAT